MSHIHIIANGGAKVMADEGERTRLTDACMKRYPDAHVKFADKGHSVGDLVRSSIDEGASLIAAAGGDGTINAVASELYKTHIVLGVLPMGTLNHFSRDLGIPEVLEEALDVLDSGNVDLVDVGTVNDRIFLNNSGLGLYPDMVHNRVQRQKRGLGKWPAVFIESARAFARYRLLQLSIEVKGKTLHRRTPAVFVGNNEYSLEGTLASKRTSLNGGCLSLYVPNNQTRAGLLWLSIRAFFGSPKADETFDKIVTDNLTIRTRKHSVRVSLDGEVVVMQQPLQYCAKPKALKVMLPRNVEGAESQDPATSPANATEGARR